MLDEIDLAVSLVTLGTGVYCHDVFEFVVIVEAVLLVQKDTGYKLFLKVQDSPWTASLLVEQIEEEDEHQ